MSKLIWHVTMSLDGFIAGPDDSMDWAFRRWTDDGEATVGEIRVETSALADDIMQTTGAILGGRRWYDVAMDRFDGVDGIYGGAWNGPVFVLTHRPPEGEHHRAITFVDGDLAEAVAMAREAGDGKNVVLFGASIPQQCLREGLLDEIAIHLAPVLLGDGIRLYGASGGQPIELRRTLVGESGQLTDLRFRVEQRSAPPRPERDTSDDERP